MFCFQYSLRSLYNLSNKYSIIDKLRTMATIGTHNGIFHCDEVLACGMLKLLPEFKDSKIIRSRDLKLLEKLDVVLDVGGTYDPLKNRFDHHQRGFFEVFSEKHQTKLSTAGLVYKHFGKRVIQSVLPNIDEKSVNLLFFRVYENFIEALDGIDNGIMQYPSEIKPKYEITTDLSARVARMNPWWNQTDEDLDERFHRAMELASGEFVDRVRYYGLCWLPARSEVTEAFNNRFVNDPSGRILVFTTACPWKDHLDNLENELCLKENDKPLYVIFPDITSQWRVRAVPKEPESFESRLPLPDTWRGLTSEELSKVVGIEGCVFAHHSGFIGGHLTREGAIEMAKRALSFSH